MTGGSTVVSQSALVAITIPSTIGSSDPLVALIVGCCPPYQTTTTITTAKGVTTKNDTPPPPPQNLSVTVGPDTYTQRNAILRCLCGPGYHGALDTIPHLLLLGGHYASTTFSAGGEGGRACKSPVSACAMASIASWMSVASSLHDNKEEDVMLLLSQLNVYLATRSFVVVPSPRPTLADLDLYFALLSRLTTTSLNHDEGGGGDSVIEKAIGGLGNVRRWLHTCSVTVNELMDIAMKNSIYSKVPMAEIPMLDGLLLRSTPKPTPIFFYGIENEDGVAILSSTTTSSIATSTSGKNPSAIVATTAPTAGGGGQSSNAMDGGLTDEQKKASADKKAKKNAEKAAAKAKDLAKPSTSDGVIATTTSESSDLTIAALDIRVGRIIKAWEHESSDKLYCEEIDLGESTPRKIASGLRVHYTLDEMQNKMVLVLCNLKSRNLGGFPSHGMVLCASNDDHTKVEFAIPPEGSVIGERVLFDGYPGEPEPENKIAKKKMFEALAPDLQTDVDGVVVWRGAKGNTSAGVCRAINGMANGHVS